jgi:prepilin-type N-terminal cleavage/methylation domain-containing protein
MKTLNRRQAFTLIEVLIVVVIMAILAATIIPQFTDSTKDAKASTVKFNLATLRSQIQLYRTQHNGVNPSGTLAELTATTDASGAIGTGANFVYGPYLREVPLNPFTNSKTVTVITVDPATAAQVTGSGGWLYNATTGNIWIDHATYFNQ